MVNKKGVEFDIFSFSWSVLSIILIIYLLFNLDKLKGNITYEIGDNQMAIFKLNDKLNEFSTYQYISSKYMLKKAFFEMANKGSFSDSICQNYFGYNLWSNKEQQIEGCFPDHKQAIIEAYKESLKEIVQFESPFIINPDGFSFAFTDPFTIHAIAKKPIKTSLQAIAPETKLPAMYYFYPSFSQSLLYDPQIFNKLKDLAKKIIDECSQATVSMIDCINNKIASEPKLHLGYCPLFNDKEKGFFEKNIELTSIEIPYYPSTEDRCKPDFSCPDYPDEKYCLEDPCKLNCVWADDTKMCTGRKKDRILKAEDNYFKFCYLDPDYKLNVLEADKIVEKPLTIRFALYITDFPPPPIEGIKTQDSLLAENSMSIRWKKSPASDVKSYSLYSSAKDFSSSEIKDNSISAPDVKKDSYEIKNQEKIYDIDLNCKIDPIGTPCKYLIYDKTSSKMSELKRGRLYYMEKQEEYLVIADNLIDGQDYYIAVTAVDNNNNEIKNLEKGKNIAATFDNGNKKPEDDLPPSKVDFTANYIEVPEKKIELTFNKPKNVDGTDFNDFGSYKIYCSEEQNNMAFFTELKKETDRSFITNDNCKKGYYIAVKATDDSGNDYYKTFAEDFIPIKID